MRSKTEIDKVRRQVASKSDGELARVFRALSDEKRLMIMRVFLERHNLCVSELSDLLQVSVPAASAHMRILEAAKLVKRVRQGQSVCFEVGFEGSLMKTLTKVIQDRF